MSYEVTLTPEAKRDLREIYRYIAVDLQSVQNANNQLGRLERHILNLNQMPERFRLYDREPWRNRNLRVMPVDHYLVFYIPDHQEKRVTVLRVMYGGRDVDALLQEM
ncbi:type II toxin-antitoxin system RelE/ParE family toxin [Pseudoflavonifractor sp. An85]|uniref:type II toxin-antitoxin system RelE/ParE family toxin n=1 Tax=Pseudoflavonifractor sp. An85 TaxID=1965661 RepID=UPI000B3ACAF5|nr:type II toxin-antitoxin system RelE/ParE family toxin [Pseudoflavonifractor sp. An85]OUN21318.1 addiction module toxin RelE [Pseudoflavonifractor sp. An85]